MILVVGYKTAQPPERAFTLLGGDRFLYLTTISPLKGVTKFVCRDLKGYRDEQGNIKGFLTEAAIRWSEHDGYIVGEI